MYLAIVFWGSLTIPCAKSLGPAGVGGLKARDTRGLDWGLMVVLRVWLGAVVGCSLYWVVFSFWEAKVVLGRGEVRDGGVVSLRQCGRN